MNLLSANLALRPLLPTPCLCEPDYHLYNAHEPRVRGFAEFLRRTSPMPEVLVLQEVMWFPTAELLSAELLKLGYSTHENIDPINPMNRGSIEPTTNMPVAPSGLAIYVRDNSAFRIVDAQRFVFKTRIGVDQLAEKGFAWMLVETALTKTKTLILTLHPQAYLKIEAKSPPCEDAKLQMLRNVAQHQVKSIVASNGKGDSNAKGDDNDIWRRAIETVHRAQFQQIQTEIARMEKQYPGLRCVLAGDLNVNRFSPLPWSADEQDKERAQTSSVGAEYKALLSMLPGFVCLPMSDVDTHPFSWDTSDNSFAKGLVGEPPTFQRIDGCWIKNWATPLFSTRCETVCPMRMPPTPELSPFWTGQCLAQAMSNNTKHIWPTMKERLVLGWKQLRACLLQATEPAHRDHVSTFTNEQLMNRLEYIVQNKLPEWKAFLKRQPADKTSQLWLGVNGYPLLSADDWGVQEYRKARSLNAWTLKIGQPHTFRMLSDVSDHHGLMVYL